MNSQIKFLFQSMYLFGVLFMVNSVSSCTTSMANDKNHNLDENSVAGNSISDRVPSEAAKNYWYDGTAELSSFKLTQARYGELHEGTAVLVYVTEPFSKKSNTKADNHDNNNVPVLKLNSTKKFNTGIYPYSMMTSTFFPFEHESSSLKITSSMQEWCGMTHMEMKNEKDFIFKLDSYFEGLTFKNKHIKKEILEDDLWSIIRLNPELLPIGEHNVIPSMFFLRLSNSEVQAYKTTIALKDAPNNSKYYTLEFPELSREITIQFESTFPHAILGWEESHHSGYGKKRKILSSKATRLEKIKIDYWNKNLNEHKNWRAKLGLNN